MSKLFGWMMVSRASCNALFREESPCGGAVRHTWTRVDHWAEDCTAFRSRGRNHREENGVWIREEPDVSWKVFIGDAGALENFIRKYGEVILDINRRSKPECLEITIHDDYVE